MPWFPDATQKVCGFPSARTPPIQPFAPFRVMLPHALLSHLPHSSSFKHFPLLLTFTFLPNLGQPPPGPPPSDASFYPVCSRWSCQGRVRSPFARGRGRSESLLLNLSFPYSSISFLLSSRLLHLKGGAKDPFVDPGRTEKGGARAACVIQMIP